MRSREEEEGQADQGAGPVMEGGVADYQTMTGMLEMCKRDQVIGDGLGEDEDEDEDENHIRLARTPFLKILFYLDTCASMLHNVYDYGRF